MFTQGSTQGSSQATQAGIGHGPTTYTIAGVKVEFPTKAYPSQIAMMNKVIQGLKQKKNCLLESPTGSGKTLALLCAALAWQRHEAARVAEFNAAIDARNEALELSLKQPQRKSTHPQQQGVTAGDTSTTKQDTSEKSNLEATQNIQDCAIVDKSEASSSYFAKRELLELTDDDDDDFQPSKRPKSCGSVTNDFKGSSSSFSNTSVNKSFEKENTTINSGGGFTAYSESKAEEDKPYFVPPEKKLTVPKIFFGTRTHKQIAQITRELRKTYYKPVRSAILSSRDHTCINPMVEGRPNKNEACRELLDSAGELGGGCGWHMSAKKLSTFPSLAHYGVLPGYDLEDLVKAGREAKACPYYATRFLMANADLIFCPYNYIIDPVVRKSMNIELVNQIVIFDEAHNMEDAAREAASFVLKQNEMQKAMQDCEKIKNLGGSEPYALGEMAQLLSSICVWIDSQSTKMKELSFNTSGRFWTGTEVIASLHNAGMTEERLKTCDAYMKAILAQKDRDMELMKERGGRYSNDVLGINIITITILENVFRLFQDMYKDNGRNRDDFRIALVKSIEKRREYGNKGPFQSLVTFTLNVWCLNPAIAFAELRDSVHTIVLTSGTLSPMQSFQSELGTPFPLILEASHVIDKNQVWAGVIGTGPNGVNLNGSYQNAESLSYQDEIGSIVQFVCDTMPYGVLCFFPSYRMMDKMIERWTITGRYNKIEEKKLIVSESRGSGGDFETGMVDFYNAIKTCDGEGTMGGKTGAIYLAVYRGKVSEGLDFSDNNARAVICIGIPFPNYRDLQVELKRDYNQKNMNRGLLSGGDWYEIQAFRALNQALGRCIRHRQDWGGIFLVDDRYIKNPRYIQSLSRWIRSSVVNFESWSNMPRSLTNFRNEMLSRAIPTETSFGNLNTPAFSGSISSDLKLDDGGGNIGQDSFLQLGMNLELKGNSPHHQEPLASFSNAFNSGCNNRGLDNSSTDSNSDAQLRFPARHFHSKLNNPKSPVVQSSVSSFKSPIVKSSAIAALFARQRLKTDKNVLVTNAQNSIENNEEDEVDDPNNRSSNKRAREKKIRL